MKDQILDPLKIPVIIINFNQLFYLNQLISFLKDRKFKNIIIIDNKSSYPPLLDYYKSIEKIVTIEYMDENYGHRVFFENPKLYKKYARGYYILTDADIVPNNNLPKDFLNKMLSILNEYKNRVYKVGFALNIDDLPEYYPLKQKVIKWEKKFWENQLSENIFLADIDTTFAIYHPVKLHFFFKNLEFYKGIRIGGNYTAKHGGWYLDPENLSEETKFYFRNANNSSSWKFNNQNQLADSKFKNMY